MNDVSRIVVEQAAARVTRTISLDWYDGPRAGFVWLAEPKSGWYFTLWAEAPSTTDVDDRLYALSALPDDADRVIESALAPLNPPAEKKHWVPEWRFPATEQSPVADAALDSLIDSLPAPSVVVRSTDLDRITGAWLIRVRL